MKISIEELEQALKNSEKRTKYELFLDENIDTITAMIEKGYSDTEITKAINIYLAKVNMMKREAKKKGKKIDESIANFPATIPRKVIGRYLKQLRKAIDNSDSSKTVVKNDKSNDKSSVQRKSTTVAGNDRSNDDSNDNILRNRKTTSFNDV